MAPLYPPTAPLDSASGRETAPPSSRQLRAAFQRFPRSLFVGAEPQSSGERTVDALPDRLVSTLLEALALTSTERVLEIGADSAYLTALLSHLAREVFSVSVDVALADERARELRGLGCANVHIVQANPATGWPSAAPYQAIVVGAGTPVVPLELLDQLDVGGRMIIPVGDANAQMLECIRKRPDALHSETLGACRMKMLAGAPRSPSIHPWTGPRDP